MPATAAWTLAPRCTARKLTAAGAGITIPNPAAIRSIR